MLSTKYRQRMEFICGRIARGEEVQISDIIWAQKIAKSNHSAESMLRRARRVSQDPEMIEGGLSDFMNQMDIGDPDPTRHKNRFDSADEIVEWFRRDKTTDWRQRD